MLGDRLARRLERISFVAAVRGRGLMLAIDLVDGMDAPELARRALLEQRLVVNATGPATVRLEPPLIVSAEEIDDALARLEALAAMSGSDYLLPEGMTLAEAGRALAELLDVRDGRTARRRSSVTTTRSTAGIHEAGLLAAWEDGQLTLTERASDRARGARAAGEAEPPAVRGGPPRRRPAQRARPLLEERALLPVVEIRNRERLLDVLDSERKTVVAHAPAAARARSGDACALACMSSRCAATTRRSSGVGDTLTGRLGLWPTDEPLIDEAVLAGGGRPGGTPSKVDVRLERGSPRTRPRRRCCRRCSP